MHEEILLEVGLSLNESRIYEKLIELGEASVNTLSVKTKINRSNVYDAMERLCEKGLATEMFFKNQKHYKAVHPRRLLELLKEKENIMLSSIEKRLKLLKKKNAYCATISMMITGNMAKLK